MDQLDAFGAPKKARVEIIPLIDVIFFLLATFVLFALSLERLRQFNPDLPKAGPVGEIDETTLSIQASAGGSYYWKRGGDPAPELVAAAQLRAKLLEYRDSVGTPRVFIRSDTTATLGDAVRVLDEVRRAGIRQVAVETMATKPGS